MGKSGVSRRNEFILATTSDWLKMLIRPKREEAVPLKILVTKGSNRIHRPKIILGLGNLWLEACNITSNSGVNKTAVLYV